MIKTGIDIVDIERISLMKNKEAFVERIFTQREKDYFLCKSNPNESIASHFAAKEAFSKFLGTGIRNFNFKDIEVCHDDLGKPYILFKKYKVDADLSLSHTDGTAVAVVCGDVGYIPDIDELEKYKKFLPVRKSNMHKGDCGRILFVSGSRGMTGAAALCGESAMRCGSGLVTVATADTEQPVLAGKLTEAMTLPLPSENGIISENAFDVVMEYAEKSDVCGIGPGLGRGKNIYKIIDGLVKSGKPLLIDADGLNALSEHIDILKQENGDVILTPHPGEMSRLCGKKTAEIENNRETTAMEFAKSYGVTVVLKGKNTVIASPDGRITINPTGNSGMASGGMGDVLSGVIASFMGQGLGGYDAAVLGTFVHGLAGDIAAYDLGEFGMIAGDVVKRLPQATKLLTK